MIAGRPSFELPSANIPAEDMPPEKRDLVARFSGQSFPTLHRWTSTARPKHGGSPETSTVRRFKARRADNATRLHVRRDS